MKILRFLLAAIGLAAGCSEPSSFQGAGSSQNLSFLKVTWGITLPTGNPTLMKHDKDLMVYMVEHDKLDEIKKQVAKPWLPLGKDVKFMHEKFVVDGSVDTNVEFSEWKENSGIRKVVCLDKSTGVATFFTFKQ